MKAILLALLLFYTPLAYSAEMILRAPTGGDFVILSDEKCKSAKILQIVKPEYKEQVKHAHYHTKNGDVVYGCWIESGNVVSSAWEDGDFLQFPLDAFKPMTGTYYKPGERPSNKEWSA